MVMVDVRYAILGYKGVSSIKIGSNKDVAELKNKLKTSDDALARVNVRDITLFKVNIAVPDKPTYGSVVDSISQHTIEFNRGDELDDTFCELSTTPGGFPTRHIHILVELPAAAHHILIELPAAENASMEPLSKSKTISDSLKFIAPETGSNAFTPRLLGNNYIDPARNTTFFDEFRQKLKAPRSINEDQQNYLKLTPNLDLGSFFKIAEGDPDCSPHEIAHYGLLFFEWPEHDFEVITALERYGGGTLYYAYIGAFLCKFYSAAGPKFQSEGTWPFALVAQVGATLYSYRPRNDFLLLLAKYPFLLIEVCSDRANEHDRWRMLLQAGLLVRVMNSFKQKPESFIAVAIYINSKFIAERYLVGQPRKSSENIIYVRDEFNLKEPPDAFRFFFELHNLPSAFPPDDELINVAPKLESLLETVTNAQMSSFTKKPTKKKKTGEADLDNSNAPPGNSTWGGSHLARELSNLGIQLGSGECPGWDRINDLPDNLRRGRTSDGNSVVLKLVKSRELEIHSFLSSVKSRDNHTIPILHTVALGTGPIIMMPDQLVLTCVASSVFETSGDDFASQFIAGVRFMHQQNVAHLDLKPDNILVTPTTTKPRLRICDYDVSARVAGLDSWMTGYRGTPGWAAPEITEDLSKPYQPIRADLWSTGRVTEYIDQRHPAHTSCVLKVVSNSLLTHDPRKRPLLSKIHLPDEGRPERMKPSPLQEEMRSLSHHPSLRPSVSNRYPQKIGGTPNPSIQPIASGLDGALESRSSRILKGSELPLKRRFGVSAKEKEVKRKRKCVQPSSGVVSQGAV